MKIARIATALSLFAVTHVTRAEAATLTVGHGIDGRDLGLDQSLAVDIAANGSCLLTGVTFGVFSDALELDPGTYTVRISLSDGSCGGALAVEESFTLALTENATAFAHITEQGTPTLTKFTNDVRATTGDAGRLSLRHTAAAPGVALRFGSRKRTVLRLAARNGEQSTSEVTGGRSFQPRLVSQLTGKTLTRVTVDIPENQTTNVFAVGTFGSDTFTLLVQRIPVS